MSNQKDYLSRAPFILIFLTLVVLSFFLLEPILSSLFAGLILAFIFTPLYNFFLKKTSSRDLSASIVLILLILLIAIPLWLLIPILIKQSVQIFIASQSIDLVSTFQSIFPASFYSEGVFPPELTSIIHSFITNLTRSVMDSIAGILLDFPTIFLQSFLVFFTFFYGLKDGEKFVSYIKSILPFPKKVEERMFKSSKEITSSVLYGQIIIGFLQGILVGLGFFLFGVDNALFLTILASLAGVLPVIGATVVWIPVAIYLLFSGEFWAVLGITAFGILGSFFENSIKPMFVSRKTNIHSAVILLGMVGGIFLFGIIGFIIGPLILAYLLILLEVYRDRKSPGILIQHS